MFVLRPIGLTMDQDCRGVGYWGQAEAKCGYRLGRCTNPNILPQSLGYRIGGEEKVEHEDKEGGVNENEDEDSTVAVIKL